MNRRAILPQQHYQQQPAQPHGRIDNDDNDDSDDREVSAADGERVAVDLFVPGIRARGNADPSSSSSDEGEGSVQSVLSMDEEEERQDHHRHRPVAAQVEVPASSLSVSSDSISSSQSQSSSRMHSTTRDSHSRQPSCPDLYSDGTDQEDHRKYLAAAALYHGEHVTTSASGDGVPLSTGEALSLQDFLLTRPMNYGYVRSVNHYSCESALLRALKLVFPPAPPDPEPNHEDDNINQVDQSLDGKKREANADNCERASFPAEEDNQESTSAAAAGRKRTATGASASASLSPHLYAPIFASMPIGPHDSRDWVNRVADPSTTIRQSAEMEARRLMALKSFMLLDSPSDSFAKIYERDATNSGDAAKPPGPEPSDDVPTTTFDHITSMASRMFQCTASYITLVDIGRTWFLSARTATEERIKVQELTRNESFCSHALLCKDRVFVVPDTTKDPRTANSPFVTSGAVGFYAAAPLVTPADSDGAHRVGIFCVTDSKPRPEGLSDQEEQLLVDFAQLTMESMLKHRLILRQRQQLAACPNILAIAAHDLMTPLTGLDLSLSMLIRDAGLLTLLTESQCESLATAASCTAVMQEICQALRSGHRNACTPNSANVSGARGELNDGEQLEHELKQGACAQLSTVAAKQQESLMSLLRSNHPAKGPAEQCDPLQCGLFFNKTPPVLWCQVRTLMERLQVVLKAVPQTSGVAFSVDIDPSVPDRVVADPITLFRATLTLASNSCQRVAMKYYLREEEQQKESAVAVSPSIGRVCDNHQAGTVFMRVRVRLGSTPELLFDCEDDGPRLEEQFMDCLFDRCPCDDVEELSQPNCHDERHMHRHHSSQIRHCHPDCMSLVRRGPAGKGADTACGRNSEIPASWDANSKKWPCLLSICTQIRPLKGKWGMCCSCESAIKSVVPVKGVPRVRQTTRFWFSIPLTADATTLSPSSMSKTTVASFAKQDHSGPLPKKNNDHQQGPTRNGRSNSSNTGVSSSRSIESVMPAVEQSSKSLVEDGSFSGIHKRSFSEISASGKIAEHSRLRPLGGLSNSFSVPVDSQDEKRALVIDDSVVVRKILVKVLSRLGFQTDEAADGMEGLKTMQGSKAYDLVLCDFLMPAMDGMDCVREFRKWEHEHRPNKADRQYIVGMSAHASPKDVECGLSIGMDAYRSKPLTFETLKQIKREASESRGDSTIAASEEPSECSHDTTSLAKGSRQSLGCWKSEGLGENVVLIATDTINQFLLESVAEESGWRSVVADNGDDAFQLLKKRNWGAVLFDSDLPGNTITGMKCIELFRDWELQNRVRRQKSLFLLRARSRGQNGGEDVSSAQITSWFDGSLDKPVCREDIETILNRERVKKQALFRADDIVTR